MLSFVNDYKIAVAQQKDEPLTSQDETANVKNSVDITIYNIYIRSCRGKITTNYATERLLLYN